MDTALALRVDAGTFAALSFRFAIRSDDPLLGDHLDALLAGLRDVPDDGMHGDDTSVCWYTLSTTPLGVDVVRDDRLVAGGLDRGVVTDWLLWDINRSAVQATPQFLLFHAAALESRCGGILLPGASGSGKSTLAAALTTAGMGYLSDELVALDLNSGRLLPYAKPISIKSGNFGLLNQLRPNGGDEVHGRAMGNGQEWQVALGGVTGLAIGTRCLPRLVVAPRFSEGAETALKLMTETEAFFKLAANALNVAEHGSRGTETLAAVAARCNCLELVFSDLTDACQMILGLVRGCAS